MHFEFLGQGLTVREPNNFLTAALTLSLTKVRVLFVDQQLSLALLVNQNLSMMNE